MPAVDRMTSFKRSLALAGMLMLGAAQAQMATPPPTVPPAAQPLPAPTRPTPRQPTPPASAVKAPGFGSDAGSTSAASQESYPAAPQIVVPLKRPDGSQAPDAAAERAATAPRPAARPEPQRCDQLATRSERAACRKAKSPS